MATDDQYVDYVWQRMTGGRPQGESGIYRSAIQSTVGAALQRLADMAAADSKLHKIFYRQYDLVLSGGEASVLGLSPVLMQTEAAQRRWRVTMTDVPRSLQYRPNLRDRDCPTPAEGYYYYTIFAGMLVVWNSSGEAPVETDVQFNGNYVPLISDPSLAVGSELFDNLIDIGVYLNHESKVAQAAAMAVQAPHQPEAQPVKE